MADKHIREDIMESLSNTSKPVHLPTSKVQWNYTAKCGHINKGCSGTQQ
jgi:hypothetical protein